MLMALAGMFGRVYADGTLLLREPTVNESHVVFVYANDLWMASRDGGDAWRLTTNEGAESLPHFSPDGRMVAFTAQYDGNTDVYVVPARGGQPLRLTWHPGPDRVMGWTPDGQHVLFVSGREGVPTRESRFYKVSVDGGMPEPLVVPRGVNGQISPDGRYMAYQEVGFIDPEWRNYRAGQAKPIWILDLEDHSLITTPQEDGERHMSPIWFGDVVYFLSERDYASNIWSFEPGTGRLEQVTFHADFDVKNLNAGGGVIVYEQGGRLHILEPASGETRPLEINVRGDFHWSRTRWEDVRPTALQNASLSPTGQRALFEYRGDIFTVPKEHGDWRNISRSPGVAARYPVKNLISKPGQGVTIWLNEKKLFFNSLEGSSAQVLVNDQTASLESDIKTRDAIQVIPASSGPPRKVKLSEVMQESPDYYFYLDNKKVPFPVDVFVNGEWVDYLNEKDRIVPNHAKVEVVPVRQVAKVMQALEIDAQLFCICDQNRNRLSPDQDIPEEGETLEFKGLELKVSEMDNNRLLKVEVKVMDDSQGNSTNNEATENL